MFIYLIVNHVTGKYYVGQHKGNNLKKYLQTKMSSARYRHRGNSHLFNSMRKYPQSTLWSIHALRSDIQTREELDECEREFIRFLRAQDPEYGYNICRGGEGFTGPHNPSFGINQSRIMKEIWERPDFREKMAKRKGRLGSKASEKTRERLRLSHLGIKPTTDALKKRAETRKLKGIRSPMLGRHHSNETRKKMVEAHSHRVWSDEQRESLAIRMREVRKLSPRGNKGVEAV